MIRDSLIAVMTFVLLTFALTPLSQAQEEVRKKYDFSIGAFNNHYLSTDKEFFRSDQAPQDSLNFSFTANYFSTSDNSETAFNLQYIYSGGEQTHNPNLKQFYYQKNWRDLQVAFGQQLFEWSKGDIAWQRGLWQPRFFWDKLEPNSQGLIGLHTSYKNGSQLWRVFASGVHVPEVGPAFHINSEKQVESASPWFRPPPESIELLGTPTTAEYTYNSPEVDEIALKPSFAIAWQYKPQNYFINLAYAYKPMNQVLVSSPSSVAGSVIEIEITPETKHHHISSFEFGTVTNEKWDYWLSVTKDEPFSNDKDLTLISQQLYRTWIYTGYLAYKMRGGEDNIYFSYSHVDGGDAPDRGENALEYSYYEKRYQFTRSARVGFKWSQIQLNDKNISAQSQITYDSEQNGMWFSAKTNYHHSKQLALSMSADVLGIINDSDLNRDGGVIADYRANDRFSVGVQYVF